MLDLYRHRMFGIVFRLHRVTYRTRRNARSQSPFDVYIIRYKSTHNASLFYHTFCYDFFPALLLRIRFLYSIIQLNFKLMKSNERNKKSHKPSDDDEHNNNGAKTKKTHTNKAREQNRKTQQQQNEIANRT